MMMITSTRRARAIATLAVATLALGVGCSGDDSGAAATTDAPRIGVENDGAPTATEPEPSQPATTGSPTTDPPATEPPATEPPATGPGPEPESGPPRLGGLASVELSTPYVGAGERPLLEWAMVDGADVYGVYLYAPDESIYWTWQGRETSVFVGGESRLPDSMPGPSVVDQMAWSVVAYDTDLLPIAISDVRPISP